MKPKAATKPKVLYAWRFASSSSNKEYEALIYDDGSTSCDCPGWTRRVASDGSRTCKHTRDIITSWPSTPRNSCGGGRVGIVAVIVTAQEESKPQLAQSTIAFSLPRRFAD